MITNKSISHICSVWFVIVFMLAFTPLQAVNAAGIRYAKPSASGTGNCLSWANACSLQTALTGATSGNEIWAAAGTYKPTTGTNRSATFQLKNGVAIYGGFAGTETARSQRNPAVHVTILSGDIDNNDSQTPIITDLTTVTGNATNSYHVVTGADGATLDGFTITAGNANYDAPNNTNNSGGGMFNDSSSPTLTNVTFSGNSAVGCCGGGGGMYNHNDSSPILTNVTFSGNSANGGGGMENFPGGSPTLTNVTFSGNSAVWGGGGGMHNNGHSSPTLTNVTFSGNSAVSDGGGISNDHSSLTLTNVTFSGNSADHGGGISNDIAGNPTIRNTIFWGNTATSDGAQIYNESSTLISVSYSVVQGGCPAGSTCTNIITANPLLGTLGNHGGYTQTIPLQAFSSAINMGNDAVCPTTDQRGVARPQGAHCDIGSYEYVDNTPPTVKTITRADPNPTTASSVRFTITFSEAVIGVDKYDLSLTVSGITGAYITIVSGSGATRTVTVKTGSGHGTLRLNVVDNDSIRDGGGNPLGGKGKGNGDYFSGEKYTLDRDNQFLSTGSQDGWVLESAKGSGVGGLLDYTGHTFQLGDDASNRQYRAILSFNTFSLPDNATILSAMLKIKQSGLPSGTTPFGSLGSLYADIRTGFFGSSNSLQLVDFNATATAGKVGTFGATPVSGWYSVTLNSSGRSSINKISLTQFRLYFSKATNLNNQADFMKFYSGDASSGQPQLIITYTLP